MRQGNYSTKELTTKIYENRSETYDQATGKGMESLSKLILRETTIPENPTCLDIGSGTGITSFLLSEKTQNKGTIKGIDISPSMIKVAKRNAIERGYKNIDFQFGDAEELDFPNDFFDLVISNMTFHHIPDKNKALKEMYRVLKPGGQLALHFNGGPCFKEIIEAGMIVAGRYPQFPEFMDTIVEFRDCFLGLEDMVYCMYDMGFVNHLTFGRQVIVFIDPERIPFIGYSWDYWEPSLPLDSRSKVRSDFVDYCSELAVDRGFKFTYSTIISVGNKPIK